MKKIVVFSITVLLFLMTGCNNEYDSIGLNLREDEFLGNAFCDTTTIVAYSLREDTVVTFNANTSGLANMVLGYIDDPVFGVTKAAFHTQYTLSGTATNFGNNPTIDSLVLVLPYSGYFGDTNSLMKLHVYKLAESLDKTKTYYNFSTTAIDHEDISYAQGYTFYPKPNTPTFADTSDRKFPAIRVRLNDLLGQEFLDKGNTDLKDESSFLSYFKGLKIVAETTSKTGSLMYINLSSSLSAMYLYYHSDTLNKRYIFPSKGRVFYTETEHDYTTSKDADFRNQIVNNMPDLGQEKKLFAQPLGGVRTKINFPHLQETYKNEKVLINKAELVISEVSQDAAYFFPPYNLGLQMISGDQLLALPDDETYTSSTYFGGVYDAEAREYRFRITQYVQQLILQGKGNEGLYLVVKGNGIRGNRLVAEGTSDFAVKPLRLDLYYTTY